VIRGENLEFSVIPAGGGWDKISPSMTVLGLVRCEANSLDLGLQVNKSQRLRIDEAG
jgi:hypothetical protein